MAKAMEQLVEYSTSLKFEDLSSETVKALKIHILDTTGAIIAGSAAEGSIKLAELLKGWGGKGEATVFVYGNKVPAHHAALINGTMSRGFDFESLVGGGATHVAGSVVPGAFALAEYARSSKRKKISGKDFITAVAIGMDLNWRFRVAGTAVMGSGWLADTMAPPAVGAMGGKLLDLNNDQVTFAMGIGYNQCAGNYGATLGPEGGYLAQLSQGMGAKNGVLAAILAEKGFTSYRDMVDGRWGLFRMYGGGSYKPEVLLGNLGKNYDHLAPSIKRYPGCGATQPTTLAGVQLPRKNNIEPADIEKVNIRISELAYWQVVENKDIPINTAEALWNTKFCTATAILKGKLFVDDFSLAAIRDAKVLEFMKKIDIKVDPSLKNTVVFELKTKDGKTYQQTDFFSETMTEPEILAKFKGCNRYSIKPLNDKKVEGLLSMLNTLESVDDINKITCLF
jgi:2-methylcitrate dehydratase PrpD